MANYSRLMFSGSTAGLPIAVSSTATPGLTIHTAVTGTVSFDEVYLYAANVSAAAATLTVQWGGTTDPASDLVYQISLPANSPPIPIATGQNLNNALVVKAWSGTTNAINLTGWINRIS